jgi:hypothetical protein
MKPEAQRIAVAEACGWKPYERGLAWLSPHGYVSAAPPPDYLNDLDAMHEAEKILDATQLNIYENELAEVCNLKTAKSLASAYRWHAAAAQRAEAFLRTLKLWRDDA